MALFILFRVSGNKNTQSNSIHLGEEIPTMILAQGGNILLNIIFRLNLPGALHIKYFINYLNGEVVIDFWATHKAEVLLSFLTFSAIGFVFCIIGYISGAKTRIAERAALTGGHSET
ncbi:MAG: hypothetical protein IK132_01875 [Clostridia bacterium]|nr:hypothetical protein [Clostridia bacterium]